MIDGEVRGRDLQREAQVPVPYVAGSVGGYDAAIVVAFQRIGQRSRTGLVRSIPLKSTQQNG